MFKNKKADRAERKQLLVPVDELKTFINRCDAHHQSFNARINMLIRVDNKEAIEEKINEKTK